jgi:hypothetical protein
MAIGALHTYTHEIAGGEDLGYHDECQSCRFNDLAKDLPETPSAASEFFYVLVRPKPIHDTPNWWHLSGHNGARSPPTL